MRNLLNANFSRLWRNKVFWGAMLLSCAMGFWVFFANYSDRLQYGLIVPVDQLLFAFTELVTCFSAVFCSLFFGTEYSDGTIRNKLVVGHTRTAIYCSGWLTGVAAALMMSLAFLLPYGTLGALFLDAPKTSPGMLCLCLCIGVLVVIVHASLYCMVSFLVDRRSSSSVFCILLFFGMMLIALVISGKLEAPEFLPSYSLTINGIEQMEPIPNPAYLQPAERAFYQFFYDLIPGGPILQLNALSVLYPLRLVLFSVLIGTASTALGLFSFRKKDLK